MAFERQTGAVAVADPRLGVNAGRGQPARLLDLGSNRPSGSRRFRAFLL